ncbi:MAG: cytochrome c [Alphaproteobacteria bacterium]|nr:cytochrome c [Alphaproteobacteria bacterium]
MNIWLKQAVLAVATVAIVGGVGISLSMAQSDPISQRKALMKSNGDSMKAIKAAVDANGPATAVAPEAAKVASNLKAAAVHFVPGSDKGDTKASPDIWGNLGDFQKLDNDAAAAAAKLEASAKGGDMKVVAADFGDLGKSCGACHNKYRLK